jgi:23S rRNA (guanine2445-N2)-methyltransferase / 23S rRNA (guanine2069-N7)-methyltransferase
VGLDDLYESVRDLPWEDHLALKGTLAVDVTSTISRGPLATVNTHFVEQRVKDAVVDRFRDRYGNRPGVDLMRPSVRLNVHLAAEHAVANLDLSGDGLHRRGYRLEAGGAPLRENLAAAILIRAGWPRVSAAGGALLDPMCGSGTLLIEGAWLAGDVAPGLLRDYYGFLGWKGFDHRTWESLVEEAKHRRDEGLRSLPPILGYDLDSKTIDIARANVRRAGLAGRVVLKQRGLQAFVLPAASTKSGLVVTNPPYGKRLGDANELVPTYETLGDKLKESFAGWEAAVFTGNPELGAHLGLRAHRVNTLYNGPLECKLLLFRIGDPQVRASAAAESGPDPGAQMLANRLRKNLKHLRRWAVREGVSCYRCYDADLPEYALAVDLYEDWAHVQEYAAPATVDPVHARRRLKGALAVLPDTLGIPSEHVVLKVRRPQRGGAQYEKMDERRHFMEVSEGGLRFLVNLTDHLDAGLFLDHRLTRRLIRESAAGKRFLNLFAYTGTATVYAAAGGASSTTTIDLSATYLDWAKRNLELNGLSGATHSFVRADCREWLASDVRGAGEYDLIFLDAPTFSNSKSMDGTWDVQRDHPELVRSAVRRLSPTGSLLFSTNYRRFRLEPSLPQEFLVVDITKQTMPLDFARSPRIHRCFRISAGNSEGR